jgi:hypothetical protein
LSDNLRRFKAIRNALQKLYPNEPKGNLARQLNTLAGIISGIVGSNRSNLPKIAQKVPDGRKLESRAKRFSRWINNENIEAEIYFLPFAQALLHNLSFQTLVLAMDGSTVGRGCLVLMVSVIYKKRSLPIAWIVIKGKKGHFPEDAHVGLIEQVQKLVPEGRQVVFVGDGEFDGIDLQKRLKKLGWKYVCRTAKSIKFFLENEEYSCANLGALVEPGKHIEAPGVLFTHEKYGPVLLVCWWGKGYKDPLYLVTNMDSADEAYLFYSKRFRIETFFSDQKSRGFNLHRSHISDPTRLSRLMIAACLAYIWVIYLGEFCMAKEWNKVIHRTERCDLSLFQLGLSFLDHLLNEGMAIPVAFQMSL